MESEAMDGVEEEEKEQRRNIIAGAKCKTIYA